MLYKFSRSNNETLVPARLASITIIAVSAHRHVGVFTARVVHARSTLQIK